MAQHLAEKIGGCGFYSISGKLIIFISLDSASQHAVFNIRFGENYSNIFTFLNLVSN